MWARVLGRTGAHRPRRHQLGEHGGVSGGRDPMLEVGGIQKVGTQRRFAGFPRPQRTGSARLGSASVSANARCARSIAPSSTAGAAARSRNGRAAFCSRSTNRSDCRDAAARWIVARTGIGAAQLDQHAAKAPGQAGTAQTGELERARLLAQRARIQAVPGEGA